MASAERGRDEVVGLLVERKASLDTQDPGGSFLGGGLWGRPGVRQPVSSADLGGRRQTRVSGHMWGAGQREHDGRTRSPASRR